MLITLIDWLLCLLWRHKPGFLSKDPYTKFEYYKCIRCGRYGTKMSLNKIHWDR